MKLDSQTLKTPEGGELVVLTRGAYDRLVALAEDAIDIAGAAAARAESGGFAVPHQVLAAIFDGASPVKAWRTYRGLTQAQLAEKTGLTQPAIARIERSASTGTRDTQRKLMAAFGIPDRAQWALDPVGDDDNEGTSRDVAEDATTLQKLADAAEASFAKIRALASEMEIQHHPGIADEEAMVAAQARYSEEVVVRRTDEPAPAESALGARSKKEA